MIYGELWQPGRFWPFLLTLDTLRMPHQSNTRNNSIFDLNILVFFKNGLGFSLVLRCGSFCVGGSAFNICSSPVFHSSMSSLPIHHHPTHIFCRFRENSISLFSHYSHVCIGVWRCFSFSSMMFFFFPGPFLPCLYCPLIYSMAILCVFPTVATCLWPAGEPGVAFS